MNAHCQELERIHEIDDKNLLFCTSIYIGGSLRGPGFYYLMIEKVKLENITKQKIEENLDKNEESKKKKSSLKLIYN